MSALSGLVVADFTRVLAGPYATMLMADLGAEVVKVERPGVGDDTRAWGPPYSDGVATYFQSVNRGKNTVWWDLSQEADLAQARELVARADIVIENFRPGVMDRLGLGYADVAALNPRAIYCSITGFGRGQGAELAGYDLLVQALGGLMSITGSDAENPTKVGVALVDVLTGLHAMTGILAAVHERSTSGQGQWVEVNLLTSLLSGLVNQSSAYLNAGKVAAPMGNRHPSIAPYETLQASDRSMAVAVGNDKQFAELVDELGAPELATDERFATNTQRVAHREELVARLEALLAADTAASWVARVSVRGVPAGLINSIAEAVQLAEDLGLAPVQSSAAAEGAMATKQIRHPITFSRTPALDVPGPPVMG